MTLHKIIILVLFSIPLGIFGQEISREDYIEKYSNIAIKQMKEYGIPASITIAQALLESDNGNSYLAIKGKNHFGIKCHNWKGETITKDDDKRNECFRKYKDELDSYKDYALFLSSKERYSSLFQLKQNDYKRWAKGLRKAGYARDKKYPQKLIRIIEDNKLYKLDDHKVKRKKNK